MTELWKPIKGYEGLYEVSILGEVISAKTRKNLKQTEHNGKQPYFYVTLSKQSKMKKWLVHRLVAEAFIPNPDNKKQVNHIDGDVHNNKVSNLEWVTNTENTNHAYENHLRTKKVIWIFDGKDYIPLRSLCEKLNLDYKKVHYRIKYLKWSLDKALDYKGGGQYVMCKTIPSSTKRD